MSIAENIAAIRSKMNAAAVSAGRDPKEIKLCAATKMNGADAVRQGLSENGFTIEREISENDWVAMLARVQ